MCRPRVRDGTTPTQELYEAYEGERTHEGKDADDEEEEVLFSPVPS